MAKNDTTLPSNADVTDEAPKGGKGSEPKADEVELSEKENPESQKPEGSELDAKSKGEFINALGEKNKKLKAKDEELSELQKQLAEYQKKERDRRIADMSEAEKLSFENEELRKQLYQDKVTSFARTQIKQYGLDSNPLADVVASAPWLVPGIREYLTPDASWEEVQRIVEERLPAYLETLTKQADGAETKESTEKTTKPKDGDAKPTDAERPAQATTKRIWKKSEIAKMPMAEYEKHRDEIHKAMFEDRVVD